MTTPGRCLARDVIGAGFERAHVGVKERLYFESQRSPDFDVPVGSEPVVV